MTFDFAVQPSTFRSFDQYGCLWATDLRHAQKLATLMTEAEGEQTIWKVPHTGNAMKWMTIH